MRSQPNHPRNRAEWRGDGASEKENLDEDIAVPGGVGKVAADDVTFPHPKANEQFPIAGEGVLIELVRAPPEVIAAFAAHAA